MKSIIFSSVATLFSLPLLVGCSNDYPLVANDDLVQAAPCEVLELDLLGNDINETGGRLHLGFRIPLENWGAPGEIVVEDGRHAIIGGKFKYRAPDKPGTYAFKYWLYNHDPTASSDEKTNTSTAGLLQLTIVDPETVPNEDNSNATF